MKIKQFPYEHETLGTIFGYLLYNKGKGLLIDPNSHVEVENFCSINNIEIEAITNTHLHGDHIIGNEYFIKSKKIDHIAPKEAAKRGELNIGNETIFVKATPGHSADSVVFYSAPILISGDTLFNGTIGNCFTGDYEEYFLSLTSILLLPANTEIYAGHDIVDYAIEIARKIDPKNPHIESYLKQVKSGNVSSTIEMELRVNPFVRWDDRNLDQYRKTLNMPVATSYERFRAMMTVH